jgi:hypothetical protein
MYFEQHFSLAIDAVSHLLSLAIDYFPAWPLKVSQLDKLRIAL